MSKNRNIGIKTRLTRAFMVTTFVSVAVGVIGIAALYNFKEDVEYLCRQGAKLEEFDVLSDYDFFIPLAIMCVVLLAGIIMSVIFATNSSRAIRLPLEKIMQAIEQVGETGDLDFTEEFKDSIRDDGKYKDEMGRLSYAFDKMMRDVLAKVAALDSAASGDLTVRAPSASEKDTLANATNQLIGYLNDVTRSVRESLDQLNAGILQISQAAQALAQSTMQQSVTMEGLSLSISDVANQAAENAKHSTEASDITTGIWKSAEDGRDSMDKMMGAMDEISSASQSISAVMKAIDDIAFQTNILSLNAAVEAARAGQHGRGFGVVSDEIRNLATRSADAAKDSNTLIANTISKSGLGSEIVKSTSDYLNTIMDGISESTWILKNIASASSDQNDSIDKINKGFQELSNVVHRNSATAEESAAATQQMSSQTDMLLSLISVFKTDQADNAGIPNARRAAPPDDKAGSSADSAADSNGVKRSAHSFNLPSPQTESGIEGKDPANASGIADGRQTEMKSDIEGFGAADVGVREHPAGKPGVASEVWKDDVSKY